ncbi:hypothetical protein [uncultured Flavobacterium sp.]|uniref:hypothetical protein n=1 Tax=uncultured Flavobacterium sp. TaxID=165435 RepID=UPI0025DBC0B4|nr:hypothetical protein [uncultured Flavobacterium sp.]
MKGKTKQTKSDDHSIIGTLLFILVYRIVIIIFLEDSTFFNITFYIILFSAILILYNNYVIIYENVSLFFLLSILIFIIFPLTHQALFKYTDNNYTFSEDYLKHKKKEISFQLNDYNDVNTLIKISNKLPSSIQNLKIVDSLIGKRYYYKGGFLIIDPGSAGMRPQDRERNFQFYNILFYDKTNSPIAKVKVIDESIIEAIHLKQNKGLQLRKSFESPESNIHYADIWLDSVTIFIFSNIKPIGRITQIIQLFQVITSFFFGYMVTSLLDNFKKLKIIRMESLRKTEKAEK